jgi:hypothetical protein
MRIEDDFFHFNLAVHPRVDLPDRVVEGIGRFSPGEGGHDRRMNTHPGFRQISQGSKLQLKAPGFGSREAGEFLFVAPLQ